MATQTTLELNAGNPIGKCSEFRDYEFTRHELEGFAKDLAQYSLELARLEQAKKEVNAQLKSQIEATAGQIKVLAGRISASKERRMTECEVWFHYPTKGRATVFAAGVSGLTLDLRFVREREMTGDEMQERLPFAPEEVTTERLPFDGEQTHGAGGGGK